MLPPIKSFKHHTTPPNAHKKTAPAFPQGRSLVHLSLTGRGKLGCNIMNHDIYDTRQFNIC
jgi:hypothetical protein